MKTCYTLILTLLVATAIAQNSISDKIFYGGGAGFSFSSNQTNLSLYPIIGYKLTPKLAAGVGLTYQWVRIQLPPPTGDQSLNNFGWSLFTRYHVTRQLFAQAEFERLNFEYFTDLTGKSTDRTFYNSFLLGAGFVESIGGRSAFFITALYNVLYDANDEFRPYNSPWVIRAGVGVGF